MIDTLKLHEAAAAAKECEDLTGMPAALTLAQGALESGWFEHCPGCNVFGIKSYRGEAGSQSLATKEWIRGQETTITADFATFSSLQSCFEKHAQLITQAAAYQMAWRWFLQTKNVQQLVRDIAPIYATDPQYAAKVLALMRTHEIQSALQDA